MKPLDGDIDAPADPGRALHRRPGVGVNRRGAVRAAGGGGGYAATDDTHFLQDGAGGALITETGALLSDGT